MLFKFCGFFELVQLVSLSEGYFEQCDNTYNLNPDTTVILQSPFYPDKYTAGSSCRCKFVAPLDYEIAATCTITLDNEGSTCTTEYFFISREGRTDLNDAEQFCESSTIQETSLFRTMVIAYISTSTYADISGEFTCQLDVRPQACDCGWSATTRIVGGSDASPLQYPSMVNLYHIPTQEFFCGASIVNHRTVVTAAHCTRVYSDPSEITLVVGSVDRTTSSYYTAVYYVNSIIEHPSYDSEDNSNDIALLITEDNIEWSRGVGPICLPFSQTSHSFTYTSADIMGWGTTEFAGSRPNILQTATMSIIPNSDCLTTYPTLVSSQLCTYYPGQDSCQFDSGGPVTYQGSVRQFLLGIISFGNPCGDDPGVNTRVTSFLSWIQQNAVGGFCNKPFN